jgi:hypothetical protein
VQRNRVFAAAVMALLVVRLLSPFNWLVALRPVLLVSRSAPLAGVFGAMLRTLPKVKGRISSRK